MKKYLTCLLVLIMLLFTGCIKSYKTVTFDSDGGTPVESIKVEKGNTINEPSAPTKEKYEFVGWFLDGEKFNFKNTKIEKNITLKAGWLKNEVTYEVIFKDYDGTELKKETVKEGNSATAPVLPTREGYTFTGWDKDFTNVQSNLVITAQYEKNEVTYEVVFKDYDGTELKKETVKEGNSATAPVPPTREGYTFTGWDKDFTNVQSNLVITAQYEKNEVTYEVVFKDYDGTELKKETVKEGNSATAPVLPTREGYTFTGWDKDFTNVQSNLVITAQYEKNEVTYEVIFKDYDGTELKKETVKEGNSATAPVLPTREGYTFTGWDKGFTNVHSNLVITAKYEKNEVTYEVVFKDYDGTELKKETVKEGNSATAPVPPTREGYTFTGWDKGFTNVQSNLVITAQYEKNEVTYEVIFKDYDGTELKKETVKEGNSATAPVLPTREGYTFTGWDKDFTNVQSNLVITAQYEKNEYPLYINGYNTQGATSLGTNQGLFLFKKGTTIGSSLYWYKVAIKINNGKYIVSSVAKSGESTPTDYDYLLLSYESDTTGAYTTLVGLNLKENDIVTFSKDITTLNNGAVNVGVKFAKVEIKTYNLTLNTNGGEVTYNNTFTNDEEVILPIPTKTNYIFDGWYLTSDFSGSKYTKIEKGTTQDLTFYAKWKEILTSIGSLNINGYNTQGATSLGVNQGLFLFKKGTTIGSSLYWYKVAIKINNGKYIVSSVAKSGESTPTDYDYILLSYESDTTGAYTTLVGLNLKENDIVTFSKDITTLSNGAVEVTVEFSRKTTEDVVTSTLTLELNGGVTDFAKATFTNFEEVILPIPTKANCIFGGWYLTNDFSGEKYTKIEKGTKQDMKFYAKWEEESYENLLKYVSDVVTSYTNDTLPTTFNGLTLEWSSSNNNLYQIVNGIGSTNRVYQTHKKQSVTITLKVDNQIFTKTIIINPVLFDDMTNPKAVYFAIGSASNYKNNSQRYKDEGTLFSDKFKNNMDMVYYAFAIPQTSGQVTLNTQYISELMKLKKNGIRVLMVIDGANRAPLQAMVKLCNNDETRKTFVSNIVSLITKYNFDGVDIDWEFPGVSGLDGYTTAIDQVNLNKLLRDLRNSLDSYQDEGGSKYIISAAIPSTSWGAARYKFKGDSTLGGINDYCDYVNMMSYDLNKSDYTSHVAACYSSKNANDYKFGAVYGADKFISLGLDKNKIILGTAAYGKAYSVTGTSTSTTYPGLGVSAKLTQITGVSGSFASGTIYYTGIANLMTNPNYKLYTEMNNGKVVGSYLYNNIDKIFITFDSSLAVKSKCEYAKANGMGIMVWAYGEDATDTIVDTICDNLK